MTSEYSPECALDVVCGGVLSLARIYFHNFTQRPPGLATIKLPLLAQAVAPRRGGSSIENNEVIRRWG